ncbi:MAG TPA: hypothetical protein VM120_14260, partial [Bryobacteraceae bacterium]|nr:hypothetical protein [Bryobacteraceae bacterium]
MTPSTYQRVKAIFGDALDISTTDRVAFVRLRADGDAVVETEVLRLLDLEGKPLQALDGLGTHRQLLQSAASLHAFYAGEV